jgi:hypothetical protein
MKVPILLLGMLALHCGSASARVYMVDDAAQLAAAIVHSNGTPEADLIDMAPGLYVLDRPSQPDGTATGLPSIRGDLRIRGNGAELRRYAAENYQLLHISPQGRLHLDALTLAEGSHGALHNEGTLVLRRVRIVDHSTASRGEAIIRNSGALEIRGSEIGYNLVDANGSHASVLVNTGTLLMEDSSFTDNRLSSRHPEGQISCALLNHGQAELRRVRITGCQAEQLNPDSIPRGVLNMVGGSLLIELVDIETPQIQLYGAPLAQTIIEQ